MVKIEEEKEKILEFLRKEKAPKIKLRLCALNLIVNLKMPVKDVSFATGIPERTIYDWIKYWSDKEYNGLKDRPPSEGRPPKLDKEKIERLKTFLKERSFWTTKEVKCLI